MIYSIPEKGWITPYQGSLTLPLFPRERESIRIPIRISATNQAWRSFRIWVNRYRNGAFGFKQRPTAPCRIRNRPEPLLAAQERNEGTFGSSIPHEFHDTIHHTPLEYYKINCRLEGKRVDRTQPCNPYSECGTGMGAFAGRTPVAKRSCGCRTDHRWFRFDRWHAGDGSSVRGQGDPDRSCYL